MLISILINVLLTINVIVCVLLIFVVLMQRPKSEGLGAAFGGGMTENLFGAQTTNVLTNITRWLGGTLLTLGLVLSILFSHQAKPSSKSKIQEAILNHAQKAPAAATAPLTTALPAPSAAAPAATASDAVKSVPAPSAAPAMPAATPAALAAPSAAPTAAAEKPAQH